MARKSYKVGELLALRGHAEVSYERHFIDSLVRNGNCSEILRVRHLVPLPNGVNRDNSGEHLATAVVEPVRQQLDGQELDVQPQDEQTEPQTGMPQSAPADLGPQFSAGFGQFIKAVTSPTNVRVTAGGRIVANTRGTSPTGKNYRDKGNGDGFALSRPGSQAGAGNIVGHYIQPHAVYPAFNPVQHFAGPMPPMTFFPGMPYPMAPLSVGSGIMANPATFQATHPATKAIKSDDSKATSASVPQQKPVLGVNGEILPSYAFTPSVHHPFFPQSPLLHMPMQVPMPMMHPHMAIQTHAGSVTSFAAGASMPQAASATVASSALQSTNTASNPPSQSSGQQVSTTVGHAHSINAPASSIKLSDVIKKHLDGFREHLKWCQSQLDYNKHQIDERDMLGRIDDLRNQIRHNEVKLEQQLAVEKEMARMEQSSNAAPKSAPSITPQQPAIQQPTQHPFHATAVAVSGGSNEQPANGQLAGNPPQEDRPRKTKSFRNDFKSLDLTDESEIMKRPVYKKDRARSKNWNTQQRSKFNMASTDIDDKSDVSSCLVPLHAQSHNIVSEPPKKSSRLPMNAALAPPFQPRGYYHMGSQDMSSDSALRFQDENTFASHARTRSTVLEGTSGFIPGISFQNGQAANSASRLNGGLGKPYLEGRLRHGVDPRKATDEDYHYPRKLTKDELQARRLYWGKAPESVTKGLPKYDGKNFYPASPVKDTTYRFEEPIKSTLPVGGYSDYGFIPAAPVKVTATPESKQVDYKALLQEQYAKAKGAEKEKRSTKSDNINGGPALTKKSFKDRPTTSLVSQDVSDSDQTKHTRLEVASEHPQVPSSGSDSSHEILFQGRRSMQRSSTRNGLWQNLGKKSSAGSANALPGAMSSTTAHGVLPQYAGTAAASLNPAKAMASLSVGSHISPSKAQKHAEHSMNSRRGENKPPVATKGNDTRF